MFHIVEVDNDGFKVYDSAGALIDPAKDASIQSLVTALTAIKDTDGIKKIADALPSGTNEIGKAAQGTKAAANAAWPFYIVDNAGNVVGVVLDGAVYRIRTEAKIVRASDGAQINPATQETLAAIKDTDGIKKITDALPAGTNEVGKVAQGTRAAASAGWPEYLVDSSGNVVGVVLDGALYRLQTDAKIAKGASSLVHLDTIDTTTGRGRLKATLYSQEGDPITFGTTPSNPTSIQNDFVKNGSSPSLLVNGSSTPVVFTYNAHSTLDISIQEIKLVLVANGITFGSGYFGSTSGPLTNGALIEITSNGNTGTVYNLIQNESFINLASPGGFSWVVSNKDVMSSVYLLGGGLKLIHGSSDKIKVTIRDNLTACGLYFACFVKGNLIQA